MTRSLKIVAGVVGCLSLLAACSDNHKVGAGVDTTKHVGGNLSLGAEESTTTTPVPVFTIPAAPRTTLRAVVTSPPSRTGSSTPVTQAVQSYQIITINSDNSSETQFSPSSLSVYAGTPVHWQNHDTKARSVVEDNGAFRSPSIPPGGEWVYTPTAPGTYNYQDGTRPYAVGSLTVVAR